MQADLITELKAIEPFEDRWRELAELRGNAFITPEWFRAWWDHRPASIEPLLVAVRHSDGSLAGVVPFVLDAQRRPRAIRFAGATWGDRFGLAARLEDESEVAAAAIAAIQEKHLDRYMFDLDHVDVDAAWWRELQRSSGKRFARVEQQRFEVPYVALEGLDWDAYLATRSRNFRQQLRQRERRLSDGHAVTFRAATAETLELDLAHLFSLHDRRWAEQGTTALKTPGVAGFLRAFAVAASERGWLRLRLLEIDEVPAAAFLGWRVGDVYAFYQSGFDPAWASGSVGTLLMADTLRSAIEEGATEFDMLLGNEPYKKRFTNASREVQTVLLTGALRPARILALGEAWARRRGAWMQSRRGFEGIVGRLRKLLPTVRRF